MEPRARAVGAVMRWLLLAVFALALASAAAQATITFVQKPANPTNQITATFAFHDSNGGSSFACKLDGVTVTCAPQDVARTYSTALGEGNHTFSVQPVGGTGIVAATTYPWTVDLTPPTTQVTSQPPPVTNVTTATFAFTSTDPTAASNVAVFTFTSTEAASTFQCSFDGAPFTACTSPDAVDVPGSGPQTFKVRAIDPVGNADPSPATHAWTSDLTPPKRPHVTIFAAPTATTSTTAPLPVAKKSPGLEVTFTNPLKLLLSTPTFTLADRLHAQWSSDATAKTFDVTIDTFPQDSTIRREWGSTARTSTSTASTEPSLRLRTTTLDATSQ